MLSGDHPFEVAELEVIDEENRYVWVDENGIECGPVHRGFSKAITFITTFEDKHRRLTEKIDKLVDDDRGFVESYRESQIDTARENLAKLTPTGKRPVELRRLLIRTYVAPLSDKHQAAIAALMDMED